MADKRISGLTAIGGALVGGDLFEVELAAGGASKKATVTQISALEAVARAAQDDVIEASSGLSAAGAYAMAGTNYLDATTDICDALEELDYILFTYITLMGGSVFGSPTVTASTADILTLNVVEKTLVATPGANYVVELIDVFATVHAGATPFANGSDIKITYAGETDALFTLDDALVNSASDIIIRGLPSTAQTHLVKNKALVAKCDTAFINGNGNLHIHVVYKIVLIP